MKVFFSLCVVLLAFPGLAADSGDAAWLAFREWLKTPAAPDHPAAIMKAYSVRLASSGLSEAQVKAQLAEIQKRAAQPGGEFSALLFDKIYSSAAPLYNSAPSAFLARAVQGLAPGKALDVAMGQGRNSLFLARAGWDVTGYDISAVGLAAARQAAAAAGLKVTAVQQSHERFEFGVSQWDLIVLVFPQLSLEDQAFLQRLRDSLKPGGAILVEQFNASPVSGAKGPPNALFKTFQDFRVIRYEDVEDVADWGKQPARIGRLVAVKE